jgi:hypothetical protein
MGGGGGIGANFYEGFSFSPPSTHKEIEKNSGHRFNFYLNKWLIYVDCEIR